MDRAARSGAPDGFRLRGLFWRLCLGSVPWPTHCASTAAGDSPSTLDPSALASLVETVQDDRAKYVAEKIDLLAAPTTSEDDDPLTNNPLLFTESSPWAQFYRNKELLDLIKKDVERLYLDDCGDYFQVPENQNLLTNILFVWSKRNPEVSYRQVRFVPTPPTSSTLPFSWRWMCFASVFVFSTLHFGCVLWGAMIPAPMCF